MDINVQRLIYPPANFSEFVAQNALGVRDLYGEKAELEYRQTANAQFLSSLRHPSLVVHGVTIDDEVAGYTMTSRTANRALITATCMLERYLNQGIEEALVQHVVSWLRAEGVASIVSECVSFPHVDARQVYGELGFEHVPRAIMTKSLAAHADERVIESRACVPEDEDNVVNVLVKAYEEHAGRFLHFEVASAQGAREFLVSVWNGGYGIHRSEYLRIASRDSRIQGILIGSLAAKDVGFVLQVAVDPKWQNRGVGAGLLADIEQLFQRDGMVKVALGVTCDNPARHLYERLGYKVSHPVDAYYWHRSGTGFE